MKIYISGPMTGYVDFNYPEFHRVAALLREAGHIVVSPAEGADAHRRTWVELMKIHIPNMIGCDGIVCLEGWGSSKGALLERHIADALELEIYDLKELLHA